MPHNLGDEGGHHCDHDKHQSENPPEFLDVDEDFEVLEEGEETERLLADKEYAPIRIYANYDYLLKTAPSSYTSYIRNDVAPAVIAYFQAALKVKYPLTTKLKLSSSVRSLCSMTTPSALKTGVDADYAILFNSRSESTNVVASSKYCYLASGTNRPLIATTNFNRQMFKEAKGDLQVHEKNLYLLIHEMMHTFGFSSSTYKYFLSSTGKRLTGHVKSVRVAGITRTVVDIPSLTNRIRTFFGCSTVPGAIMENNGGSGTDGSHFEKKFFTYEILSSGSESGRRVSEFSLALLEASGWYQVDYNYAEPYFYGKGQGCNFINGACSSSRASFDEFCTGSSRGCAFMGHSGGYCSSNSKTDGCRFITGNNLYHCERSSGINYARLKTVEVYGPGTGSRCFTGTLNTRSSTSTTSFCFNYSCSSSGALEIILGSKRVPCTREGAVTVSGYYGTINCPDPKKFCETAGKRYCPRSCMGRGTCNKTTGKCTCNRGFTGVDCALRA